MRIYSCTTPVGGTIRVDDDDDLDVLSHLTEDYSGADVAAVCRDVCPTRGEGRLGEGTLRARYSEARHGDEG